MPHLKCFLTQFKKSRCGNMAISFAVALGLLVLAIGAAIDISGIGSAKLKAQSVLDGAVLASVISARDPSRSVSEINSDGVDYFKTYYLSKPVSSSIASVDIDYDPVTGIAIGSATINYQPYIMGIFGFDKIKLSILSEAIGGINGKPMDVGIMLDLSGSMAGVKLEGLQSAVTEFLDILIGPGNVSESVRVAYAPFSTSVNAGPFAPSMIGGPSLEGCVGERSTIDAFTDEEANGEMFDVNGEFGISNDENNGVYREAHFRGFPPIAGALEIDSSTICSGSEIFPLSGDYDALVVTVNGYDAGGLTAGHLGIAFAWYLISERWDNFWPAESEPGRNTQNDKIVILMSDGEFNTYFRAVNGLPNEQGEELCDNMKADGVTVYAISFDNEGDSADLLQDCASETDFYFDPESVGELNQAFQDIGERLKRESSVRLTR